MSHHGSFSRSVAVLSLLASTLTLMTTHAAAQDDDDERVPPVTILVVTNAMVNADKQDGDEEKWQARVTVRPLSGCVPRRGDARYQSSWLNAGEQGAVRLSLTECVFEVSAVLREASGSTECTYVAQLAWGRNPADSAYGGGRVLTSSRPGDESRLSIRRSPGSACSRPNRTHFIIRGAGSVDELPDGSADADLAALARRAAEIVEFQVRVAPDYAPGDLVPTGCGETTTFAVSSDGQRVPEVVQHTRASCRLRASVVAAPAPFEAIGGAGVSFDGSVPNVLVDLTSLVRLPYARIAIIQDVAGSGNRGAVSYVVARSCGNVAADTAPRKTTESVLHEGRFTVHSPDLAAFGPIAVHPVGAASLTSGEIVGCSVSVTISNVPEGCVVAGRPARTQTWTAADPVRHFDFEFAISCGTAPATPATTQPAVAPTAPPTTASTASTTQAPAPTATTQPATRPGPLKDIATG